MDEWKSNLFIFYVPTYISLTYIHTHKIKKGRQETENGLKTTLTKHKLVTDDKLTCYIIFSHCNVVASALYSICLCSGYPRV